MGISLRINHLIELRPCLIFNLGDLYMHQSPNICNSSQSCSQHLGLIPAHQMNCRCHEPQEETTTPFPAPLHWPGFSGERSWVADWGSLGQLAAMCCRPAMPTWAAFSSWQPCVYEDGSTTTRSFICMTCFATCSMAHPQTLTLWLATCVATSCASSHGTTHGSLNLTM